MPVARRAAGAVQVGAQDSGQLVDVGRFQVAEVVARHVVDLKLGQVLPPAVGLVGEEGAAALEIDQRAHENHRRLVASRLVVASGHTKGAQPPNCQSLVLGQGAAAVTSKPR